MPRQKHSQQAGKAARFRAVQHRRRGMVPCGARGASARLYCLASMGTDGLGADAAASPPTARYHWMKNLRTACGSDKRSVARSLCIVFSEHKRTHMLPESAICTHLAAHDPSPMSGWKMWQEMPFEAVAFSRELLTISL